MDKVKEREGGDSQIEIEAEKGEMMKTLRDRDIVIYIYIEKVNRCKET